MKESSQKVILCNGAELTEELKRAKEIKVLEYRVGVENKNVNIQLPRFVRDVMHLPPRILDLLEIAGYIFAADRLAPRGDRDILEYHSWARAFHFVIKVRDFEFWSQSLIQQKLSEALVFMTGDKECNFSFQPGHTTKPAGLFDNTKMILPKEINTDIMLFSGGLDSLAGAIELLNNSNNNICLVSHQSGHGTIKTQDNLFRALKEVYHSRVRHYRFKCNLVSHINKGVEETQRTRAFLYTSIAYAICHALGQSSFYVHENGVTSLNFYRRQDAINGRTSRTTHPKTIALLRDFFSLVQGAKIKINTPFQFRTKTDVFKILARYKGQKLIPSAVSCSKTFLNRQQATHCGGCFQCIDRRIASFASGLNDIDESGIYNHNLIQDSNDAETKTTLIDYIGQAMKFYQSSEYSFAYDYMSGLADLAEPISELYSNISEEEAINKIWQLCKKHGEQVQRALVRIQELYADPYARKVKDSLLQIIAEQPYFKEPVSRLVESVCNQLHKSLPVAFEHHLPLDETDLNDKINSIIEANRADYEREYPGIRFASATTIPDHSFKNYDLLVETKYIRKGTPPSKATDGIAADITKYCGNNYKVLFVVYDRDRAIVDDDKFCGDFQKNSNVVIKVFR